MLVKAVTDVTDAIKDVTRRKTALKTGIYLFEREVILQAKLSLASSGIICGSTVIRFFETLREIRRIIESNQVADLRNVRIRLA